MEVKKKISGSNTPYFFSKEMIITKKSLNDYDDKTFVELIRIDNGEIKVLKESSNTI